jgi:transcriptional regulator with XRE-family HTH domain
VILVIDMIAFGNRLKQLREEMGLEQVELAKKFPFASSTICQYEKGNRMPDAHKLERLATYFNVSVDYLLCRTNRKKYEEVLPKEIPVEVVEFITDAENTQWIQIGMLAKEKESSLSYDTIKKLLIGIPGAGQHRILG